MERYLRFVLSHRRLVLVIAALISAVAVASLSRAEIATTLVRLFFGENPAYEEYRKLAADFGGNDLVLVAYRDEAALTAGGVARLERITKAVAAIPDVRTVDSLASAQRLRGQGDDLVVEAWPALM